MQNQILSGARTFQKPPLVQKCSKTRHSLGGRCDGPGGRRARKCTKNRHSFEGGEGPSGAVSVNASKTATHPGTASFSMVGMSASAPSLLPIPGWRRLRTTSTPTSTKGGAAGRYAAAAPWLSVLPGHSATFQKSLRAGPCVWSFPLDKHPGLLRRLAVQHPRRLGGRSGTRTATLRT